MSLAARVRPWYLLLAGLLVLPLSPCAEPLKCGLRAAAPAAADQTALKAAAALYEGIQTVVLDNGLRVYLKPIPGTGVVTTMVAYKVGSADEELDSTGLSHYLEHLMFKGTEKLKPGDIDRQTLINGGANNAYTSEDYTIFHFDFAADRWPVALEIEADRMRNLRIDKEHQFQEEKGAVLSELERDEDQPWDLEYKAVLPLLFGRKSPYGHPVIGEREHVRAATAEIIKAHYDRWYHPNNASLILCGDFDPAKAIALVRKLFGPIPSAKLPERKQVVPEKLARPARHEFPSKFEVPRLLMAFNTVAQSHADTPALDVLASVLSGGKTTRLHRQLVEGAEIASDASASHQRGRYPGYLSLQVELLKGKDRAQAEKLVLAELKKLRDEPITAAELKRVQQGLVAGAIFDRESVHGLADNLARGVTVADLGWLKSYLPALLSVTPADVQRVAKKYLQDDQRVVIWSVPGAPAKEGAGQTRSAERGARSCAKARSALPTRGPRPSPLLRRAAGGAPSSELAGVSLKGARRVELPNGLVLLLLENHRLPIVVAHASVKDVTLHEPADKAGVAALTGYLLDEGTRALTGPQIAELIEDVGGSLSLSSGGGSVKVLTPHRSLGLKLLLDCLSQPSFPAEAFARQQQRLLSGIAEAESQPAVRAQQAFSAAVYGSHPYGRPSLGTKQTVGPLQPADCAAFHKKVFVPNNTLLAIVGDFDSQQIVEEVTKLTEGWKKVPLEKPTVPAVEKQEGFRQRVLSIPEAAQLYFYLGHVGIRRDNPDYYKLVVMDYVLGTGPGFTDRLSSRLRDTEGLAYTVSANISSSAAREPGTFSCYIGTQPENFERVKKEFLEELHRIRDTKPTEKEVENAKRYLLGSLPFLLTTDANVASQLLSVERYGLGFNYLEKYRAAISAVTPEDVQAVAKKYIDPDRMILVAAGAIDRDGKPLKPATGKPKEK